MRWCVIAIIGILMAFTAGLAAAQTAGDADVKAALEAFQAKQSGKTRKALDAALEAYVDAPTSHTVAAHLNRVGADSKSSNAVRLRKSAVAAHMHIEPVAAQIPDQYAMARFLAATSLFNHRQSSEALIEMAHLKGWLGQFRQNAGDDEPDWARPLYYRSDAWLMAMDAYYVSAKKSKPSEDEIEAILAEYEADDEALNQRAALIETEDGELPFCRGGLRMQPSMKYPAGNARKGMFGAVIVGFDLDAGGKVKNVDVLASVPDEGFKERAAKTVSRWQHVPDPSETPGTTCRLERENLVQPVIFSLGR